MHLILWQYQVRPEKLAAFLYAYGPEGAWARLFRNAEGFEGVELLRDDAEATRFVTIDRWRAKADFEAFKSGFSHTYEALDAELGELTLSEIRLGAFDVCG